MKRCIGIFSAKSSILILACTCWLSQNCVATVFAVDQSVSHAHGIRVFFEPEQARPGDLVTLNIEMNRKDYAEFSVRPWQHPQLSRVDQKQMPVQYQDGRFAQRVTLIYQIKYSGTIHFKDQLIDIEHAQGRDAMLLPALKLIVAPFQSRDETDTPVLLSAFEDDAHPLRRWQWWSGILLTSLILVMALMSFLKYRSRSYRRFETQRIPDEARLLDRLDAGHVPIKDVALLLEIFEGRLSDEVVATLEKVLYDDRAKMDSGLVQLMGDELILAYDLVKIIKEERS